MLSRVAAQLTLLLVFALAILAAFLAWISLQWPIVGDAGMFHFAASQFRLGEVPYRDFFDMNMPLIYVIHLAIITVGGMSDLTFRIFDLGACALVGVLAAALVWPKGRSFAALAALTIIAAHLLDGPQAAGERDFLLLVPVLTVALLVAWSVEHPRLRTPLLILVGVNVGLSVLLKPTAILLIVLPFIGHSVRWRSFFEVTSGLMIVGLITVISLLAVGSLPSFINELTSFIPYYQQLAQRPLPLMPLIAGKYAFIGAGGLCVAALYGFLHYSSLRARAMIVLVLFGVLHFILQGKGFFYHVYPLLAALACLGAWTMPRLPRGMALIVFALSAAVFGARGVQAFGESRMPGSEIMPEPVSRAMEASLTAHVRPGARVQMLDMSGGAFLAMARAGMRQATPFAFWLYLDPGKQGWRDLFIKDLKALPPDAILVTDATWPSSDGFKALDEWPMLKQQIDQCYRLADSQTVTTEPFAWAASSPSVSWRLYMPRTTKVGRS